MLIEPRTLIDICKISTQDAYLAKDVYSARQSMYEIKDNFIQTCRFDINITEASSVEVFDVIHYISSMELFERVTQAVSMLMHLM